MIEFQNAIFDSVHFSKANHVNPAMCGLTHEWAFEWHVDIVPVEFHCRKAKAKRPKKRKTKIGTKAFVSTSTDNASPSRSCLST